MSRCPYKPPEAPAPEKFWIAPGESAAALRQAHGDLVRLTLNNGKSVLCASGVEAHKTFLVDNLDALSNYEGWNQVGPTAVSIGRGVIFMDGPEHRWFRKLMTPAFAPASVASLVPVIHDIVARRLSRWPRDGLIGLYSETSDMTFHVAAAMVLGTKATEDVSELHDLYRDVMLRRDRRPAAAARRARLAQVLLPVIRARRASPAGDVLSQLICSGGPDGPLSDDQLVSHINTLMIAGHFTAAGLAAYLLLLLVTHPPYLERLVAEQRTHEATDMESLSRLRLLDNALMEAERLLAPIPHLPRKLVADMSFQGHELKSGEFLLCSVAGTHRDPELFDEPDKFDPDRFAPPRSERRRHLLGLAGFNVGPRRCLGTLLAQGMIKIMVNRILRGFTLTPEKEAFAPSISLPICHPTNSMPFRVTAYGTRLG
jgi:retinoid hydroxylase